MGYSINLNYLSIQKYINTINRFNYYKTSMKISNNNDNNKDNNNNT